MGQIITPKKKRLLPPTEELAYVEDHMSLLHHLFEEITEEWEQDKEGFLESMKMFAEEKLKEIN